MARRTYRQSCLLTSALDVVGERWTLLLVRELLLGPQRYKDLLDALPGIGTDLLTDRLRTLADVGALSQRVLPPPAGSTVYELTELGQGLAPTVVALSVWGVSLLGGRRPAGLSMTRWGMFWMQYVLFRPEAARGVRDVYEFRIDDETFHVRVDSGTATTHIGRARSPDVVVSLGADAFWAVGVGELKPMDGLAAGRIAVEGMPPATLRCLEVLGFATPEVTISNGGDVRPLPDAMATRGAKVRRVRIDRPGMDAGTSP